MHHIAEPLKVLAARHEELRKTHAEYAGKLEKEKDAEAGRKTARLEKLSTAAGA